MKIFKRITSSNNNQTTVAEDLQFFSDNQDPSPEENWLNDEFEEGQLSIDVYETAKELVIKSTIAGVKPEDIDISINNDMLTVRGKRERCREADEEEYIYKECYWGSFSRSLILPTEVRTDRIQAFLENGILTIRLLKSKNKKQVSVKVKEL